MPCVGFEPTIPASERAKTVYVLDRSATVTGLITSASIKFNLISTPDYTARSHRCENLRSLTTANTEFGTTSNVSIESITPQFHILGIQS
jgi:hypothetical protein